MIEELIVCDESRIPVVWFVTHEEARAEAEINAYAEQTKASVWIWSLTSNNGTPGWEPPRGTPRKTANPFDEELSSTPEGAIKCAIDYAREVEDRGQEDNGKRLIAILRDPHVFLNEDMTFVRILRDATSELKDTRTFITCISPGDKLPIDLQKDVPIICPGLPKKESLKEALNEFVGELPIEKFDDLERLAEACVGLTLNQAADAIAKSCTQYKKIDLDFIQKIKTKAISSVPGLTYIGETPSMENVGGLDGLKAWLEERKQGFTQEARDAGLPIPRGVLCLGVPGCGKSLTAKAVASYYQIPLVRFNPSDLKGGIVGETEGNMRRAREAIESLGQCVVWNTELELKDGRKIPIGKAYEELTFPTEIKGFSTETGEEQFVKVWMILKRPKKKRELLEIELESGKTIQVTLEHKILTKKATGEIKWERADKLLLEDDIIEITSLPEF